MTPLAAALTLGMALACTALGRSAAAAEVRAEGPFELTITGFVGMLAHGGELGQQREEAELADGLDFSMDTEVHVLARARDGELGLEYGSTIEFEADTDEVFNTDEAWIFLRSSWGELRFGDVDGPVDASALGAFTIAAGTGGIDGDVVDELAVDAILPFTSDTGTKVRYYTPSFGGVEFGVSYAPTGTDAGQSIALTDTEAQHLLEAALIYEAELDQVDLTLSIVGGMGELDDAAFEHDRMWTWYAGGEAVFDDLALGAGVGVEDLGGERRRYANAGLGYHLDEVYLSLTHGRVISTSGYAGVGEPWNLVLSADLEIVPGLILAGDVGYFDNDLDPWTKDATGGDRGWLWVAKLEVVF